MSPSEKYWHDCSTSLLQMGGKLRLEPCFQVSTCWAFVALFVSLLMT